jgi:vacuolar-type H+-ATPase subunit I/STV1
MNEQTDPTYRFEPTTKSLLVIRKHSLVSDDGTGKEGDYGNRENRDFLTEKGIKKVINDLQTQKTHYEKQIKNLKEQLTRYENIEVDEEFLKKLEAVQGMQEKNKILTQLSNGEEILKTVTKELRGIKDTIKNHIKL